MKCDSCKHKIFYKGSGQPDDCSCFYCYKGHWENGIFEEDEDINCWDNCQDFEENTKNQSEGEVKVG